MPAPQASLAAPATAPGPRNCRVYERHLSGLASSCQPAAALGRKDAAWPATIADVSQGGVRLTLRRRFEPGAGLAIALPSVSGDEPALVLARVVHVRSQPDGSWALGCKFISELSEEEVNRLLPTGLPGAARPGDQTLLDTHPATGPAPVRGVQLEVDGPDGRTTYRVRHLYLPGPWPPVPGRRFAIRGRRGSAGVPELKLQVLACTEKAGGWIIRCLLLNPRG